MTGQHSELLQYADDVWRLIVRVLGDCEDANDCFQQTYVDALSIKPTCVKSWRGILCTIATRRTTDVLRQRYGRVTVDTGDLDLNCATFPVGDALDFQDLRQSVRLILGRMPPLQADAFVLRHLDEMPFAEVAKQLDVTPGHARVLVHRAVTQLRTDLPNVFLPNHLQSTSEKQ